MTPLPAYHELALQHKDLLAAVTHCVCNAAPVRRLYLLGLTASSRQTQTLFSPRPIASSQASHAYLLALVEAEDGPAHNATQDRLENRLQHLLPATVIVLSLAQFAQWASEGHPFADLVCHQALLLYTDGPTTVSVVEPDEKIVKERNEKLLRQTVANVREFLACSHLCALRLQHKQAAFLLHQAAEQVLRTRLALHTGLVVNTHNLDKLLQYNALFCSRVPVIFPAKTEANRRLLRLLQRAYVEVRYKADAYSINGTELGLLTERVEQLSALLKEPVPPIVFAGS